MCQHLNKSQLHVKASFMKTENSTNYYIANMPIIDIDFCVL